MADFDYIVVGGGPAGCALAARLSNGLPDHRVLLIDAGGQNTEPGHQALGERFWTLGVPGYNWGYKTVAQKGLQDREIDYSRGRGLGGSTAINFCVYTRGPKADYDHWAEIVDDDSWAWKKAEERFKKIENFHSPIAQYNKFVEASAESHGSDGPVDISISDVWDPGFDEFMQNSYQYYPKNTDHNAGDPIGVAVCQTSANGRSRVTASGAYLEAPPTNLTIRTDMAITRVVFENKKAIGVAAGNEIIYAKNEVILAAGAIDSPKLLLLSGVGPVNDLQSQGIQPVLNLPGVGKNLQDRLFLELATIQKDSAHHRTAHIADPVALGEARKEWIETGSGPLSYFYLPQMIAYLKSDKALASEEFSTLDESVKRLRQADTSPLFEIISQNPSMTIQAPEKYLATAVAFPGTIGTGELKLQSSDPNEKPLIDPRFLMHPFDKRLAIESVRETLEFLKSPLMFKDSIRFAAEPESNYDEDILAFVQKSAVSMWHMCGTVKMGKLGEEGACVDKDCKVLGVENLRVVDMSVAPFLPSAHLQAVAYLIGQTAGDKIVDAYRQDRNKAA